MRSLKPEKALPVVGLILAMPWLSACHLTQQASLTTGSLPSPKAITVTEAERDCLGRAMYFEAKRSEADGLLAVGTVVMNRFEAASSPGSICGVVGQPRQFATGLLTKPMAAKDLQTVADVTDAVLDGARHPQVGRAMHFHVAGRRFPYDNMHYVAEAGGNVFYEKRKASTADLAPPTP